MSGAWCVTHVTFAGYPGDAGLSGRDGESGVNGATGQDGLPGFPGSQGLPVSSLEKQHFHIVSIFVNFIDRAQNHFHPLSPILPHILYQSRVCNKYKYDWLIWFD